MMAKKVVYTDDLDGTVADAGTVQFSWDGITYEADLSLRNKAKFSDQLGPLMAIGRVVKPGKTSKATAPASSGLSAEQLKAVRDWAGRNGYRVSDRGRVPQEVLKAFEEAQQERETVQFSSAV